MKTIKEYAVIAMISGILGIFVAIPFAGLFEDDIKVYLTRSFTVGFVIGFLTKAICLFFFKNIRNNQFKSIAAVLATISAVTFSAAYVMGLRHIPYAILITLISDTVGVISFYTIFSYARKINEKLLLAQSKIREDLIRK
jgi:hypothetical protein